MDPIDFHSRKKNTMEVNGDQQLFNYQPSLKYLILCLAEERKIIQENHTGLEQLEGE